MMQWTLADECAANRRRFSRDGVRLFGGSRDAIVRLPVTQDAPIYVRPAYHPDVTRNTALEALEERFFSALGPILGAICALGVIALIIIQIWRAV